MTGVLIQVWVPHFCCGVLVGPDYIITEVAPIVKWAKGQHFRVLRDWLYSKGGGWQNVDAPPR